MLLREIAKALEQKKIAENKFNWATGEEVDIAALELIAAEMRYNLLLKQLRQQQKEEGKTA